ncbi:hypothetical protein ABPG74_015560 [Tetrahymena malaccensis]
MAENNIQSNKQPYQTEFQDKAFNQNIVVIVEDKQVSDFERLQHQNDLSSLYSSQKQAYNFESIGDRNSDEYIESMLNSRNQTFNKNQQKFQQQKIRLRSSTTFNYEEKNNDNDQELKILQQIKNSQKKNVWQQISENILTPFAPKFQGLYDNSKFIPEDLLKMEKDDDKDQTPYSEEKEINWESSEYDSEENDSQILKNNHHIPSLVTSPLLRKKTRTENYDTVLQKAQLQEPFLHTKLIKQITESNEQMQKRKSEYSPLRYKSLNSKSFYSKVSFADQIKANTSNLQSSQKNFMRKVRFEHLPNVIKEQVTNKTNDLSSSQYQVISKKKSTNKIYLDKILIVLENQDKNALQKIYVPKLKDQIDKSQTKNRILSATASLPTREQRKKLLNLQNGKLQIEAQNTNKNQSEDFQKYLRRRSCCCEECGGVNSKLERIKDLVLDKDIPVKQQKKSPLNKTSNLNSPVSSQSKQSSFDSRFQRKKNLTTKITVIQSNNQSYSEVPKTAGSSHNVSLSKIPSLNETQTFKNQNDKKQSCIESFKDAINEQNYFLFKYFLNQFQRNSQNSPIKKRSWKRYETSQPFNSLQRAPSFKTLRQEREIKIQKQHETSQERNTEEQKMEQIQFSNNQDSNKVFLRENNNIDETDLKKQQKNQNESQEKIINHILQEYNEEQRRNSSEQIQKKNTKIKQNNNAFPKIEQKLSSKRCQSVQNGIHRKRSESDITYMNDEGMSTNKYAHGAQKDRYSSSNNQSNMREQLTSSRESRLRNDRSLPNILSKKQQTNQSSNEGLKQKYKDIIDYVNNEERIQVIQENQIKKMQKNNKKMTVFDKLQAYQNPNELVFKTKQQIIAESYQQLFDQQKKQLINQKHKSHPLVDLNIEKRQSNFMQQNTQYDNFNLQMNEMNQTTRKKSRSKRRSKNVSLKENMEKLKTVYDI